MKRIKKLLQKKPKPEVLESESQLESPVEPTTFRGIKPKSIMEPMALGANKSRMEVKQKQKFSIPISMLNLTSDDLKVGQTLQSLKQKKLDAINTKFTEFIKVAIKEAGQKRGQKILYRFYEPTQGLSSLAEQQEHMTVMDKDIALLVKDKHMLENTKSIEVDDGETKAIYYSPLLSTTKNLYSLLNKTHDTNLINQVFFMAPKLGVFVVPNEMCHSPSELTNNMDKTVALVEEEVCFDSSKGKTLLDYQKSSIDNPLCGYLNLDLEQLAISRILLASKVTEDDKELVEHAKTIQENIDKCFKKMEKPEYVVQKDDITILKGLEQQKIECIKEILEKYPLPIPEPVKVKAEVTSETKVERLQRLGKSAEVTRNIKPLIASKGTVSTHRSTPRKHTGKPSQGNAPERI